MQPIHFIVLILAAALVYSLFRIGVKAAAKDRRYQFAEGRAAGRIEGRAERVSEHNALQQSDLDTLLAISKTLQVAHRMWCAIPHTNKYQARAAEHLADLNKIATRIQAECQASITDAVEQEKAA
jgi:hypothetical protein